MIIADLFQVLRRLICGLFEIIDNEYLIQGLNYSLFILHIVKRRCSVSWKSFFTLSNDDYNCV
jgi:hypothetical protein